jgi:hypothetical protein
MATKIFVIKEVRPSGEQDNPMPEYDETHYVAAVREGVSYEPSDVYDLRGNLLSLANYVKKYCPAFADRPGRGAGDGKLWLINDLPDDRKGGNTQRTNYALLIFGNYHCGITERQSRLLVDLGANDTWQKVKTICCGSQGWAAKCVERKFGTDHKKLFLMIAPKNFSGLIEGSSANFLETDTNELHRDKVDRWIHLMSYSGGTTSTAEAAPAAAPLSAYERDMLHNVPARSRGGNLVSPTMPGRLPGEKTYSGGLSWTWDGRAWRQR